MDKDSFKHLHVSLNIILNFGDALLQDLLVMYRTVSMVTHVLARFGISAEDQVDDGTRDRSEDANGTGMGEGAGMNDVSDQITDEDQLIWALDKMTLTLAEGIGVAPDKDYVPVCSQLWQ
ncbi:midasin [Quercus suber]|uniref:Midasin n=1 Tax=Quercus suber TaxID=58331 RepID=A0AAW0LSJ8_QUESU